MDLSKIANLTIIKHNPDPLSKGMDQTPMTPVSSTSSTSSTFPQQNLTQIEAGFNEVRAGNLSEKDFKRKIQKVNPTLLEALETGNSGGSVTDLRQHLKHQLLETLYWFIQLKVLISTSTTLESFRTSEMFLNSDNGAEELTEIVWVFNTLDHTNYTDIQIDYKRLSLGICKLLKLFINDDPINPKYKIDSTMVRYLSNNRPTYLKEITVLFDLYSKVYDQLASDLVNGVQFRNIKDIQPRFDMINRHILSSNLTTRIDYDLDLNKLGVDPGYDIKASDLGLQRRLNYLNDWLVNGIVNIQTQLNRLNNLKPVTSGSAQWTQSSLLNGAYTGVTTKYHIWEILKDTSKFLETLKGLTDGTGFITGMVSYDLLDTLNVNY